MNNIKTFFFAFYQLNKREFWFLVFINIVMGIVINLYPFHAFVKAGIIIVMAGYIFNFMRSASVMPSVSSDFDRYSWKYFQGLPLNKQELLIALVLSDLFVLFPSLVWLMSFFKQMADVFTTSPESWKISLPIKIFLGLIPFLLCISLSAMKNLITFPRKQYSKIDPKIAFFVFIKRAAIWATSLLYLWMVFDYGSDFVNWAFFKPAAQWLYKNFPPIHSWYIIPFLCMAVVVQFFQTLKIWQDEKRSYTKINWQPKRDFSIIGLCLVLFWVPIKVSDFGTPDIYQKSALVNAVYKGDLKKADALLSKGEDINKANEFGFNPLMVAAREGDFYSFRWLIKRGAKIQGLTKVPKDKGQTGLTIFLAAVKGGNHELVEYLLKEGFSPNEMNKETKAWAIHYANRTCNPKIIDLLIESKADLKVVNAQQQTALHAAASQGCFPSVALLLDAGIDPNLKDNENKLAKDYVNLNRNSRQKELAFYLEKKTRAPAGN